MYTLLLFIIYLSFISLGLPDSFLGSAWPIMKDELKVSLSSAGTISLIIQIGTIISSLLAERVIKKFTTKYVTLFSVILTSIALFGFSISDNFISLCLWALPYGLGAGAIDSALNNYVALHYSSKHMNWLHSFWGLGTIISPYIMSFALTNYNWHIGYRIVSIIQIGIAIIIFIGLPLWRANDNKDNERKEIKVLGLKGVLNIKGTKEIL